MRAARAARLFSLARPIKFLICGVVFGVPVMLKFPIIASFSNDDGNNKENVN